MASGRRAGRVLITGGAGFIGGHLADLLLAKGREVCILDDLDPQVHGRSRKPSYVPPRARLMRGSVLDRAALRRALKGASQVVHLAARVGVGQSMYEPVRYVEANALGTAVLLEELLRIAKAGRPRRLIVASSMSLYGEGAYRCPACGPVAVELRPEERLKAGLWEPACPACQGPAEPVPTPETKLPAPTSVYAVTKRDQEELCLSVGRAYGLPTLALRFFNVYGPRQALSNPYTGVAAIFASRLLNGRPPLVFEDGRQSRDFVHVADIARAVALGLEREDVPFGTFNAGSGRRTTVLEAARALARALGRPIEPRVLGTFRRGDIRHCFADISRIKRELGFEPAVGLEDGLRELAAELASQRPADNVEKAYRELKARGLAG